MSDDKTAQLMAASAGLIYLSESEAPFALVDRAWAGGTELSVQNFGAMIGGAPAAVTERSLDDFLAPAIERASADDPGLQAAKPKFVALKEAIRQVLGAPRVFRVAGGAHGGDITYYVVALVSPSRLLGLSTTATET